MKKLTIIMLMALALLTMTQCRKAIEPIYQIPNYNGEKVLFSLTADNGSKGTRTEITQDVTNLSITWSADDKIYIAGETQGYLGCLTLTEGSGTTNAFFQGEINAITSTQDIHVYYLGKGEEKTISGNTTTINLGIQQGTLDDIENYHIASATIENVPAGTDDLSATLATDIAIVKFDLTGFGAVTKLYGTNISKNITLNLQDGTLTGDNTATDYSSGIAVSIPESVNSTYVALLPGTVTITLSDGTKTRTNPNKPLSANTFYSDGGNGITPPPPPEEGRLPGLFSVSATKKVYFSKGNLQYQASTNTWRFAEHQYDTVGADNRNISPSNSGWIDLFGWGTSGQNTGAIAYQPYSTSEEWMDYCPEGSATSNLTYANKADWGYNAISNGGYTMMQWRTLTGGSSGEWKYLLNRNGSSKRGLACINGINGIVLLPDNWTQPSDVSLFNAAIDNYTTNTYTVETWEKMENNGAVFLPAAGYRGGTSIFNVGSYGYYWSSSYKNSDSSYYMYFLSDYVNPSYYYNRYYGVCVRLVQDL